MQREQSSRQQGSQQRQGKRVGGEASSRENPARTTRRTRGREGSKGKSKGRSRCEPKLTCTVGVPAHRHGKAAGGSRKSGGALQEGERWRWHTRRRLFSGGARARATSTPHERAGGEEGVQARPAHTSTPRAKTSITPRCTSAAVGKGAAHKWKGV